MSNKIIDHEDPVILTKESYNSTSISVNGSTNINTPIPSLFLQCLHKLQGLSLQYLHKAVITILCLHCLYKNTYTVVHLLLLVKVSLQMSIPEDILHHFYKGISIFILLLLSVRTSLQSKFLQPSLLMSLRSEILQSCLPTSLGSNFVLISLWKIFLRSLYEDILTKMDIPSKPEIFVQGIQVKPETPKTWIPLCLSLHSYSKFFYKFIVYCMFNNNYNIDTWNIKKQVIGYIMSLKKK